MAVRGGIAKSICTEVHNITHTKNGTNRTFMPGHRMHKMVAMKLMAAVVVPNPLTINPSAQQSTPDPRENEFSVNGA
jgi:hypothetical protein